MLAANSSVFEAQNVTKRILCGRLTIVNGFGRAELAVSGLSSSFGGGGRVVKFRQILFRV